MFIVYVINIWVMSVIVIFMGIDYKYVICFVSVQGFVWIVFVIFICIIVDDGCDVGIVFEVLVMQSSEYFFGVWEFGFIMCECVIIIL